MHCRLHLNLRASLDRLPFREDILHFKDRREGGHLLLSVSSIPLIQNPKKILRRYQASVGTLFNNNWASHMQFNLPALSPASPRRSNYTIKQHILPRLHKWKVDGKWVKKQRHCKDLKHYLIRKKKASANLNYEPGVHSIQVQGCLSIFKDVCVFSDKWMVRVR